MLCRDYFIVNVKFVVDELSFVKTLSKKKACQGKNDMKKRNRRGEKKSVNKAMKDRAYRSKSANVDNETVLRKFCLKENLNSVL